MHTHIFICHFLTLWFKSEGGAKLDHIYNKRAPYDGSHCIPSYGKGCLSKVVEAWGSSHWWIAFSHELYHLSKLTQPSSILCVMLSPPQACCLLWSLFQNQTTFEIFPGPLCVWQSWKANLRQHLHKAKTCTKEKAENKQKPKEH